MGKVKNLLDDPSEDLDTDTVIDEQIDARREAANLGRQLRSYGDEATRLGGSLGRAKRRWDAADEAERQRLRRDEYGDAVRLGYVWAVLVLVIAGLVLMTVWGIIPR